MYCVFVFLCLTVSFDIVFSAVAIQLPVEKPEEMAQENGCYMPDLNIVLPYNQPYSPKDGHRCLQFTCHGDNITTIFSCGVIAVGPGCAIVPGDKYLPYPECCDKPTCNTINHKSIVT